MSKEEIPILTLKREERDILLQQLSIINDDIKALEEELESKKATLEKLQNISTTLNIELDGWKQWVKDMLQIIATFILIILFIRMMTIMTTC